MKKVIIYAYTNFNLGDDLFIETLCKRYPKIEFTLLAQKEYKIVFKELNNLKVIARDSFIYRSMNFILRKLNFSLTPEELLKKKSDAMVYIGGSIFMQDNNWKKKLEKDQKLKKKDKPLFLIGANFGPFKDKQYYLKYKEMFKTYTDVCFRDEYSFDLFKDLNNVRLADDVIFQLKEKNKSTKKETNNIIISVIKPSIREALIEFDDIYYEKIKDITVYFIEREYNVTLMSFCENEGDKDAVNKIIDIIPRKHLNKVNKYLYRNDIEEALHIIDESKFMVGTRFHAMILGWVYNKPVFPIAYSEKMTNVMEDINFEGNYTDFKSLHKLEAKDVFNSMFTNHIDVSTQSKNAEKQFKELDEYLKL